MAQSLNESMKDVKQEWVRIGDAARATGIPVSTLRRWAKAGRIPSVQMGGDGTWRLVHLPSFIPAPALKLPPLSIKPLDAVARPENPEEKWDADKRR